MPFKLELQLALSAEHVLVLVGVVCMKPKNVCFWDPLKLCDFLMLRLHVFPEKMLTILMFEKEFGR